MKITVTPLSWPMREPFAISRSVELEAETIVVTVSDEDGHRGRGEASGVRYHGETQSSMIAQIEAIIPAIEAGISRDRLDELLPAGGARSALDVALWDIEAKQSGRTVFDLAGMGAPRALETAFTIGIRDIEAYEATARARSRYALLKVKVTADNTLAAVEAVHRGAPQARLIVDPNMAWSVELLQELAAPLAELGVVLLEQPIPVGDQEHLAGYACPIPLCADELIQDADDLAKAHGHFSVVNIKLDKAGGLTSALHLQDAAHAMGFRTMIGCMAGTSLAMAPGLVIGQRCDFIDLDGPLLLADDWPDGLTYEDGRMQPAERSFWG
jgi:L-alanine-DL-glutamate epimerase-like enolase superfamily enzyme